MASYIVMEPPAKAGLARPDAVRMIRDGFSFPAFVISPLWLLWHRLWIEAVLVFVAGLLVAGLAEWLGMGPGGSALSLILSLFVGLEGQRLRISALTRRGWRMWGTVDAHSADDAFARYATAVASVDDARPAPMATPSPFPAFLPSSGPRAPIGPALGLLSYPGGR